MSRETGPGAAAGPAAARRKLVRPPLLKGGDRVAMISPSSHQGRSPQSFLPDAMILLSGWGLEVQPLPEQELRHLYFAGTDAQRAAAFQQLYLDPEIRALFVTRGGYGAARFLPLLNAERIAAAPPKAVVGFSDATSLFAWLHALAGVQTIHGPALAAPGALTSAKKEENLSALNRLLFDPGYRPDFVLQPLAGPAASETLRGPVIGGNLAVLQATLGTPWAPDPRGAILFLEEVGEQPYRIDRMLTHLRAAGLFEGLRAIVFGHLERCDEEPPGLLHEVLRDIFAAVPFPVYEGMAAGHGEPNLAFPLGGEAQLLPAAKGGALLRFE